MYQQTPLQLAPSTHLSQQNDSQSHVLNLCLYAGFSSLVVDGWKLVRVGSSDEARGRRPQGTRWVRGHAPPGNF